MTQAQIKGELLHNAGIKAGIEQVLSAAKELCKNFETRIAACEDYEFSLIRKLEDDKPETLTALHSELL